MDQCIFLWNYSKELHCVFVLQNGRKCAHPSYFLLAFGTVGWVTVVITLGAVNGPLFLKEAPLVQHLFTLTAHELLGVPGTAERHHVTSPRTQAHEHKVLQLKPFALKWKGQLKHQQLGLALLSVQCAKAILMEIVGQTQKPTAFRIDSPQQKAQGHAAISALSVF